MMAKVRSSLTQRTIPALITVFFVASAATAQYSGGTGEPNDPYQITTAADLIALGKTPADYDKHFLLTADIDLDPNLPGRKVFDNAVIAPDTEPNDKYDEFQGTPFTGSFDGNGHAVVNLKVTGGPRLGLFGYLYSPASVSRLRLEAVEVRGAWNVGGLAGVNRGGRITDSGSNGSINGGGAGGLVGCNDGGSIVASYSHGSVSGSWTVGGLVGDNYEGSISSSWSSASLGAIDSVGGLVGRNFGSIVASYASGPVNGRDGVGGLVGYNEGNIWLSYGSGSVSGQQRVGGLAGRHGPPPFSMLGGITASYSTGSVRGDVDVGGLVGSNEGDIDGSFWDIQSSGQTTSAGGTGKTTTEMQTADTFLDAGWDFVGETANGTQDIWRISEGRDYPRLSWEPVLGDDFADGKAGSLWLTYEPDASKIWVKETGGRLEVHALAQADNIDAAYVSNGWRLDAAKDFALRVDFHYGKRDAGDSWVMVALLPSLEEPVSRIITFEAGCLNDQPFFLYEAIDGFWRHEEESDRSSDDGTLYVSYDAAADELYLSHTGYGKANAWRTVTDLVGDRWRGEPVYVAIGGGSDGVVLEPGDAWLDNFIISSGTLILAEPEGASGPDE